MTDILTVTMNPAVDVYTSVGRVEPVHKLRCAAAQTHPGGGGINVARVAHRLGARVLALFPAGGVTGRELCRLLESEGVPAECLPIAQETRQSFSVHEEASGQDYRFVLPGPELSGAEWQAVLDRVATIEPAPRYVVASGSLPPGVPDDFHARLARVAAARSVPMVLDTSGAALAAALAGLAGGAGGVQLVKPSLSELRQLTGRALGTEAERLAAARELVQGGAARSVVLSLGAEGALLVDAQGAWRGLAPSVDVASTIGAGDSLVGGLVWALSRGLDAPAALGLGLAAAGAALLSAGTALCAPPDVERLHREVRVEAVG